MGNVRTETASALAAALGHVATGLPADDAARAERETALLENIARHLRLHPQAQVVDDAGRPRPLSRQEAEGIARVALRAAAGWLR